jgi:hypothetical protein
LACSRPPAWPGRSRAAAAPPFIFKRLERMRPLGWVFLSPHCRRLKWPHLRSELGLALSALSSATRKERNGVSSVAQFEQIRRDQALEGLSVRALARRHGVHGGRGEAGAGVTGTATEAPCQGRLRFGPPFRVCRSRVERRRVAPERSALAAGLVAKGRFCVWARVRGVP